MLRSIFAFLGFLHIVFGAYCSTSELPVRGLSIQAPNTAQLVRFIAFVETELAPRGINTLVLRVDYNFDYQSHPELKRENPLSLPQVKQLVAMGKQHGIRLIPQINLLGRNTASRFKT